MHSYGDHGQWAIQVSGKLSTSQKQVSRVISVRLLSILAFAVFFSVHLSALSNVWQVRRRLHHNGANPGRLTKFGTSLSVLFGQVPTCYAQGKVFS